MSRALVEVPRALAGYSIDSIAISAEVSATGKASLLSNGGDLDSKVGLQSNCAGLTPSCQAMTERPLLLLDVEDLAWTSRRGYDAGK